MTNESPASEVDQSTYCLKKMNLLTKTLFSHGIDKLCTICHVILKGSDRTHSIFSTLDELESPGPINVLQVLQSFSNYTFYNGPQMVCTTCYEKTIEVYKFIQMCNTAHEIMQHYSKNVEAITTIKDESNVDIKMEKISTAEMENEKISKFDELGMVIPVAEIKIEERILKEGMETKEIETIPDQLDVVVKVEEIEGRELVMENEKISKFDELGMFISEVEIKIEERILKEGVEIKETSSNEEITVSHIGRVTDEKTGGSVFDMGLIKCKDCHLVFSDKKKLGVHRKEATHTKEKPFLNKLRNALFGAIYNSSAHDKMHKCPECQEVYNNDKELEIHMRGHKKKLLCNDCGKAFTTKSRLNSHIQVHSGDSHNEVKAKAHKCEQCDRRFSRADYLRIHMNIHNGIKAHKCEQCGRRFTQAAHLRSHMDIHTGIKAHKCEQCDRRFTQASTLRSHMDIHNGIKAHKCEICDRRFTRAAHLRTHIDIHDGVKAHKCVQCDRRFSHAPNLRRHMRTHEVKLHNCEQCDCRFVNAENLRRHMNSHKTVKVHKCEQCDRRFTLSSSLRRHMNIHIGIKAYKCEQCDRRFTDASNLSRHMNMHNGIKAYKCLQCDRRFSHGSNLRRHMHTHNKKCGNNRRGKNIENATNKTHRIASSSNNCLARLKHENMQTIIQQL